MARPEAKLTGQVLLEASKHADVCSLFKNPTGEGYYGHVFRMLMKLEEQGPLALFKGWRQVLYRNRVVYGLGPGSPDLVGHVRGAFLGLELKGPQGTLEPTQGPWHACERGKGARIEIIKSVDDVRRVIGDMKK